MKRMLSLVLGLATVATLTQCKKEECPPQKYDDLKVSADQVEVVLGTTKTVNIEAGSGNYGVVSLDDSRVKTSLTNKEVVIEGIAVGATVVEVTDTKTKQKKSIGVNVVYPDIKLEEEQVNIGTIQPVQVKIVSGSGFYEIVDPQDIVILDVSIDNEKNIVLQGKVSGTQTVQIKDVKTGKIANLKVTVGK